MNGDTMWEKSDMGRIFAAVVEPGSVDGVAGFGQHDRLPVMMGRSMSE